MTAPMTGITMSLTKRHNRSERRADDHADRKINDIAAHCEFLEFFEHNSPFVAYRGDIAGQSFAKPVPKEQRFYNEKVTGSSPSPPAK